MELIKLNKNLHCQVDDADYEWLNSFSWHVKGSGKNRYAQTAPNKSKGITCITLMHRLIMGLNPEDKVHVDHKDGDGLNNQRANLRIATPSQNSANSRPSELGTSLYKGVSFDPEQKQWRAKISKDGVQIDLGRHAFEIDAAICYNIHAIESFGEYARINEISKHDYILSIIRNENFPISKIESIANLPEKTLMKAKSGTQKIAYKHFFSIYWTLQHYIKCERDYLTSLEKRLKLYDSAPFDIHENSQ